MKKMILMLVIMFLYSAAQAQQSSNLNEIREYVRTHRTVQKPQTATEECQGFQWKMQNKTGVELRAAKTLYKARRCDEVLSALLAKTNEVACNDETSCE